MAPKKTRIIVEKNEQSEEVQTIFATSLYRL